MLRKSTASVTFKADKNISKNSKLAGVKPIDWLQDVYNSSLQNPTTYFSRYHIKA